MMLMGLLYLDDYAEPYMRQLTVEDVVSLVTDPLEIDHGFDKEVNFMVWFSDASSHIVEIKSFPKELCHQRAEMPLRSFQLTILQRRGLGIGIELKI